MFNKILVVLDATQQQSCVFTIALAYAKLFHSEILLLHRSLYGSGSAATEKLRSLSAMASGVGLNVTVAEFQDHTEQTFWQLARQESSDLVLIDPSDFQGDFEDFQSDVIRNASCSVLLVQRTNNTGAIAMRMILKQKQKYNTESARKQLETLLAMSPS